MCGIVEIRIPRGSCGSRRITARVSFVGRSELCNTHRTATTAISGGTAKGHAPHCTPKTAEFAVLHAPLSTRLDEISFRRVPQSNPFFGPFGPLGRPRGPLPPSNCAKIAGAGASPPLRRCAAPWLGYAQPKTPKRGGLAASPHMGDGYNCHAANIRIPSFAFYVRLGSPLFFRSSSLYQLVLTRSRCPHFLAYLARLLAGPEALSHPVTAQNSLGRGRSPPCAPPCAATRRPGWATPSPRSPKKSSAFGGR